ncbi:MAG: CGNR zinc finger domain-containing protein [Pyrinomonadaceae bacterium]
MALNLNTDKFKIVGGAVSLDFVNTVAGRISNPNKKRGRDYLDYYRSDKLDDYADLLAWSLKAKLIDEKEAKNFLRLAENQPEAAEKVLKRALSLRESVYRLFKSVVEGWQPEADDLERLNRELATARKHQRFSARKNEFGFEWTDRENSLDAMLWQVTESAAQTLSSADLTRIRQCGGDGCNWLFLDTSRNGSRQWCDMKDCGNLAKVRRFRQRQQEG